MVYGSCYEAATAGQERVEGNQVLLAALIPPLGRLRHGQAGRITASLQIQRRMSPPGPSTGSKLTDWLSVRLGKGPDSQPPDIDIRT